jgi:hypothetical protein
MGWDAKAMDAPAPGVALRLPATSRSVYEHGVCRASAIGATRKARKGAG